jgi:exosortase D (VPLPA-CTERM-specific)
MLKGQPVVTLKQSKLYNVWLKISVLLSLFIAAYWIPLKGIVNTWLTNPDYSYGFLVPVISTYFLWDKRATLRDLRVRGSWEILPILVFFVLLSLYGILGSSGNIARPAIPILIILFVAFCFGIKTVKRLALPLGFLIFMVPLPAILDRTIGLYLKSLSSKLGGVLLRTSGMSVHVSGNIIDLGITQLQVVDACSGLRFVFPMFALGIVYAHFFERVAWKKVICVLATIPIAILTNVLRITVTGILTNKYGTDMAEGFFHGFSGWAIFMVALVFLFVLGRFLSLFPPRSRVYSRHPAHQESPEGNSTIKNHGGSGPFLISVCLLLVVGMVSLNTKAFPALKIRGGLESFPLSFGDWRGKREYIDPDIITRSGAEEAFSSQYQNGKLDSVSVYFGYRATAFLENENFFHSPTVCLPAGGWKVKGISRHKIENVPIFQNLTITKMIVEYLGMRHLVYFWFQTKDKATYNKNINRFHLALHALKGDNTHDFFIRLITPIKESKASSQTSANVMKAAEHVLDTFTREMMEELIKFLEDRQVRVQDL